MYTVTLNFKQLCLMIVTIFSSNLKYLQTFFKINTVILSLSFCLSAPPLSLSLFIYIYIFKIPFYFIKDTIFPDVRCDCVSPNMWMHYLDAYKTHEKMVVRKYTRMLFWTNPVGNTPQKSSPTNTYLPFRKPSEYDEQDKLGTDREAGMNS